MKLQEFVDEGYYINLDYRTDRREFMETQLKRLGLYDFIQREPGVNVFGKTEYIRDDNEKMFLAGQACSFAHQNIIRKAKENGSRNVLIMEDDALFYDCDEYKGLEIIESALDDLSKIDNWEIFFLGSNIFDKELDLRAPHLVKCDCCIALQGYIVNHTCFDKILENKFDKPYDVMDIFLNNNFPEKYITYPVALLQNGDNISDIGGHVTLNNQYWLDQFNKPIVKNY